MDKPKLLIVEDEEIIRSQMKWALNDDYEVILAWDCRTALEKMAAEKPSLIALDLGLPPSPRGSEEGFKTLGEILAMDPAAKVVIISGQQEKANALKAIDAGAFDFFAKPVDLEEVRVVFKRAMSLSGLERENALLKHQIKRQYFTEIMGESPCMRQILSTVEKIATTDVSVLITGESGSGKELIARAIHRASNRCHGPFITINCGAIPENLLESELFGHEKGAFTGAETARKGKVEYADGGTLLLDEIGDLSLALQVKLLRFLQEHQIERIGGRETILVDVRVIAATNRDLKRGIDEKYFREDLYYRLGVVNVEVPPLRERGEDIFLLAMSFLQRFSAQYRKPLKGFGADALSIIQSYAWPGNVRELENSIKRAVVLSEAKMLTAADLALSKTGQPGRTLTLREIREQTEKEYIKNVLLGCDWNISKAAVELEVSRPTLHELMRRYHIAKEIDL